MKFLLALLAFASFPAFAAMSCTGYFAGGDTDTIEFAVVHGKLVAPPPSQINDDVIAIVRDADRVECFASGQEYAFVVGRYNVPAVNGALHGYWYGDTARYILANSTNPFGL